MTNQATSPSIVRRLIVSEILIVLVMGLSYGAFQLLYAQKPSVEQKETEVVHLNVDVFVTEPIEFRELLIGFGTARADREVVIAAQVSGEIVEIHPQLKVGYGVTASQTISTPDGPSTRRDADLLVKIDPRDYQERVDQTTNQIEETRTEIAGLKVQLTNVGRQLDKAAAVLKTLKEEFERIRSGVEKRVSTPSELNRALLELQRYEDTIIQLENQAAALPHQLAAADQRLASSRSEKSRAENDLQRTEVVPPFNGFLSEVFVEQGRFVRAGEQLVRLTDLTRVEIPVALSFDDFLQLEGVLADGRRPSVALAQNETAPQQWTGHVVRASPEADPQSRTVQVFVEVANSPGIVQLLPGAFVNARIDGQMYHAALLIPREAVVDGTVYVVDEQDVAHSRSVRTGRTFQSLVLIEDGLSAGDRIILTNLDIVEDRQKVIVQSATGPLDEISALRSPVMRPTTTAP